MTSIGDPNDHGWNLRSRIFVAGHAGLIGGALLRALAARGYSNVITADRGDLDLTNQRAVEEFFERAQPQYVVLAAGRCASAFEESQFPADIIRDLLMIQANVIDSAYCFGVRKLLLLTSAGALSIEAAGNAGGSPTRRLTDVAKAAGLRMSAAYRQQFGFRAAVVVLPAIYGPQDRFSANRPDSVSGYMQALSAAQLRGEPTLCLPGDPQASVGLLHADDAADALILLLEDDAREEIAFVPPSETIKLMDLGRKIAKVVQYEGHVEFDGSCYGAVPTGDECSGHLRARGWRPLIPLDQGLSATYAWFIANQSRLRL
ncbi:MAG TPA: NAD-dependent epimerase/dehydratase family protein [Steroidobacter sp.]